MAIMHCTCSGTEGLEGQVLNLRWDRWDKVKVNIQAWENLEKRKAGLDMKRKEDDDTFCEAENETKKGYDANMKKEYDAVRLDQYLGALPLNPQSVAEVQIDKIPDLPSDDPCEITGNEPVFVSVDSNFNVQNGKSADVIPFKIDVQSHHFTPTTNVRTGTPSC
ncbi:hypothetical protein Tco_0646336 [Tanacetum coccineum]